MLHLYALYACVHFTGKHDPQAGKTRCVESQIFFHAEECKSKLPTRRSRMMHKTEDGEGWLECEESTADSWIPADLGASGNVYEAWAKAADATALTALLAPLTPQARATLESDGLQHGFGKAFQGPGRWSFFIVGTGASVIAYAVANLDDFQFADMATDVSSSAAAMSSEKDQELDFAGIAEDAGVQLSYHTTMSRRAMPPPGGMGTQP